jgi:hypothetical protein
LRAARTSSTTNGALSGSKIWFYNRTPFICSNGFTNTFFGANVPWFEWTVPGGQNHTVHQFEGDFNEKGQSWATRKQANFPAFWLWSVWVMPRTVQSFNLTGQVPSMVATVDGVSPCNHLGYSLVYCKPL